MIADRLVVLVTGASAGIGSAVADAFAGAGWRVFGTSRRARPDGVGVEMLQLDVRSDQCATACVRQLLDRAGRIDVLVNDAGVMHTGIAGERPHWRKPAICLTPTCFGWSG